MRQVEKKKEKDKIAIVLMLCFCVVALTSIFTIKSNIDKISDNQKNVAVSEGTATGDEKEKNVKNSGENSKDVASQASSRVPTVVSEGANNPSSGSITFAKPIQEENAKLLKEYSMDMVIYSVTLDQYMTHRGMDIAAPEDTRVKAIAAGTVTNVYTDDGYGLTIEITHDNGYISKYSNLSTDKMVEKGDVVTAGQTISGVDRTGLFESMEPAHLHLELMKSGKYIDPSKFIKY